MDQSKDLFITQISIIYHVSIMGDGGKQRKSLPFRTLAVMGKDTPLHRYAVVSHKAVKEVICDKLSLLKEIRENSMTISGGGGVAMPRQEWACVQRTQRQQLGFGRGGKGCHARTQGAAQRCQLEARGDQTQL